MRSLFRTRISPWLLLLAAIAGSPSSRGAESEALKPVAPSAPQLLPWRARIIESASGHGAARPIAAQDREAPVYRDPASLEHARYYAVLKLAVKELGWKIAIGQSGSPVEAGADGTLRVAVYLASLRGEIRLSAVSAAGARFDETIRLFLPFAAADLFAPPEPPGSGPRSLARVRRLESPAERMKGLSIDPVELPVLYADAKEKERPYVTLGGTYSRPGWKLFARRRPSNADDGRGAPIFGERAGPAQAFQLSVPIEEPRTSVILIAVGPKHEVSQETLWIYAPSGPIAGGWQIPRRDGGSGLILSLGAVSMRYFQTRFGDFRSISSLVEATYEGFVRASRWGVQAGLSASVFTLSAQPSGYGPQVIRGELGLNYLLSARQARALEVRAIAGLGYVTMLSNGSPFGFANLIAPELGAEAYWRVSTRTALSSMLLYSSEGSGLGDLLSTSQRNLELRLGWHLGTLSRHPWHVGIRLGDLRYSPAENREIILTSAALTLGIGI